MCPSDSPLFVFVKGSGWKQVNGAKLAFPSVETSEKPLWRGRTRPLPFPRSAIVSATLKCLMKFYNITDNVRVRLAGAEGGAAPLTPLR